MRSVYNSLTTGQSIGLRTSKWHYVQFRTDFLTFSFFKKILCKISLFWSYFRSRARCWAIVIPLNVGLSARLAPRAALPKRADFSLFAG